VNILLRVSTEYDPELTQASFSSLLEISLALAHYREGIVLVGGWVPYLLVRESKGRADHIGSIDIDLALDPMKIDDDGYSSIVELIQGRGYEMMVHEDGNPAQFRFQRKVTLSSGRETMFMVDFMTCNDQRFEGHRHALMPGGLRALMSPACSAAFLHNREINIRSELPRGGEASANIMMLDVVGCLAMKGVALGNRYKEKDAYDIYKVLLEIGPESVASKVAPFKGEAVVAEGLENMRNKFSDIRQAGPAWVGEFLAHGDEGEKRRLQAESLVIVRKFFSVLDSS
jgi:hypothetical protein